jgi:hypothetical protein
MKCEEAAEFVSALCDGETIPRAAAEHVGECEVCHARLKEYAEIGAEMRRVASLEPMEQARVRAWEERESVGSTWWWKGWETMRIPKFVFALLLVAIVALGSSLVMVKARAHTQGAVLMFTVKTADGKTVSCALSLGDKNFQHCKWMTLDHIYGLRVVANDGDRVELGVQVGLTADADIALDNIASLPEKQYWFRPGENLKIDVPGTGPMVLTGELMDHMPALVANDPSEQMDPKPDELRFVSPVLLRGKEVVFDFQGASAITDKKQSEVELYAPGDGLFHISLLPLEGAVEGRITMSRVSFDLNGESYMFLLAAPVARGERIWILRDAGYKPSGDKAGGFIGSIGQSHLLAKSPGQK